MERSYSYNGKVFNLFPILFLNIYVFYHSVFLYSSIHNSLLKGTVDGISSEPSFKPKCPISYLFNFYNGTF